MKSAWEEAPQLMSPWLSMTLSTEQKTKRWPGVGRNIRQKRQKKDKWALDSAAGKIMLQYCEDVDANNNGDDDDNEHDCEQNT